MKFWKSHSYMCEFLCASIGVSVVLRRIFWKIDIFQLNYQNILSGKKRLRYIDLSIKDFDVAFA